MRTLANRPSAPRLRPLILTAVYALYFATGATALVFEILWTRQFVVIFGNSSYAISVVLAAFMGGLGIGAWLFGKIVDRRKDPLWLFALIEGGIIVWALLIPRFLAALARAVPAIAASTSNLAAESIFRFAFSFAVLLVPCVLMGGTLPVLTRFVVQSPDKIAARLSTLYGLNTLGAAAGCFITGFYLIETLGQSGTNLVAVFVNLTVLVAVLALRIAAPAALTEPSPASGNQASAAPAAPEPDAQAPASARSLLLLAAFVSGFATMAAEVVWVRYLVFVVPNSQYSFTSILGVVLLGLALGSLLYSVLLARSTRQLVWLAAIEMVLGPVTLLMLVLAAHAAIGSGPQGFAAGGPLGGGFLKIKAAAVGLAAVTVFLPTLLIGAVFPLVASAYAKSVAALGRSIGAVYAVNTLGCILGSVAPMLFLVAWLGIQNGIAAVAILNSALGVFILLTATRNRWRLPAAAAVLVTVAVTWRAMPPNLTQDIFFSDVKHKGRHQEVLFYREGPTATVMVVKDALTGFKEVFIGGIEEVPTVYSGRVFFKLFGSLGPLLHPDPRDVLVLCLGGGITAGTIIQHPEVQRVECVDLVEDMVSASRELADMNNGLVKSPKFSAVIEDARNYLAKSAKKFPVIICDSTHPKSPDSWPLYTTEFYQSVKNALAPDGVFLQWAPLHGMGIREYQIILKTFQSVFPHTSVWYIAAYDEIGTKWATTVMLATPERLSIDLGLLERRLAAEPVKKDLTYWSLDTPVGILGSFLCGEDTVREWTAAAPVNTDNLPFTQYVTGFTGTTEYGWPELAPKVESVWPFVSLKGNPGGYSELKSSLDRSVAARKILLEQNLAAALNASPADPSLLRLKDNLRRSDEYLKRLREIYGNDDAVLVTIAQRMQGLCQYEGKDPVSSFEPVASVYRQALDVNPRNVSALVNLGALAAVAGSASEAQECFRSALAIDPSNAEAHLRFGTLLSDTEQYSPAIEHLERAAKLAPDRFDIQNALAIALMATGDLDRAAALFEKAIVLSGQAVPDLYFNLGHVYAAKGDLDSAIVNFRLASSANPSSAKFHLWLGIALLDKGDARAAEPEFMSVLSADDSNAAAHAKLGTVYLRLGRLDDALAQLRKALALSPADPDAHEGLAKVLAAKRDFAGALGILRDGMRLQPTAEIAKELAWLLATCPDASLRNGSEAVAIAENLSNVQGFSLVEALDTLAAAYAETGRFPEAVDAAQRALTRASIQNDRARAAQIQKRLDLYKAARPYREP